jgi:CDP-diacylglycerol--serine O-phosphatidyltransferase
MLSCFAVNFRKTYYVLPNLFTLSSVFCGFISISLSASGQGGADLYQAALAICFGFFFDTADGRVARLFVCAGAMRLARFNVLSRREEASGQKAPGKYTLGLTIPAAASVVVLMVMVSHNAGSYRRISESFVAVVVLVLSYLMVSRVKFRSFKDVRLTKRTIGLLLLIIGCASLVALNGVDKALVFLVLIMAYITLGLTETVILMKRHFVEQRQLRHAQSQAAAAVAAQPAAVDADEQPPADEDILRELGAFDTDEPEPRR